MKRRLALLVVLVAISAVACNNPDGPHNTWNVVHPMSFR